MKNLTASFLLVASCLIGTTSAFGFIAGPYTADPYTVHLWHLDETTTPCIDSATSGGTNLVDLAGGATLGNASYSSGAISFGNALNTAAGGPVKGDLLAASPTAGNVTITLDDPTTGAFTFEAMVQIQFDPTATSTAAYEIMAGESGTTANRIFQWRVVPKGFTLITGVVAAGPYMTFENLRAGNASQNSMYAPIPTTGPDAIVSNGWYHVAVTYNGVPNTPNNTIFYWTAMNTNNTADDPLTITSVVVQSSGLFPLSNDGTTFMLGNQGRSKNGNFLGSIDEVRISRVARGPSGMMFALPSVSLTPLTSQYVPVGSSLTLSSVASGGLPITYQWQFNGSNLNSGANISGFNTNSLVITNINFAEAGTYTLVAANANSTNSVTCFINVGNQVAGLFNTGVNSSGSLLTGGTIDPNWTLAQSADPVYTGPNAIVDSSVPASYLADGPNSQWIAPGDNVTSAGGIYEYQTSFILDSQNLTNMQLLVNWAADNACQDIILNGIDLNLTNGNGFSAFSTTVITNNFVPGSNNLICVISNGFGGGINLTAFRAELSALSGPMPPTAIQILAAPSNVITSEFQNATFTVYAYGSGPLSYQWYDGASPLSGQTNATLHLNNLSPGQAGTYTAFITNSISTNSASATLTVTIPNTLEWQGINTADWDLSTTNWYDMTALQDVAFSQGVNVLFDNNGSAQSTVNLDVPLSPNSVTVGANNNYTFAGTGGYLTGNFNLTVNGPGTLVLDAPNTFAGNTIIQGGTLQIGNGDANGSAGTSSISNSSALVVNRTDTLSMANTLSGAGSLTMAGSGTLVISGNNTGFTGASAVTSSGTLTPRTSTALGTGSAGITVTDGAQLYIDQNINLSSQPLLLGGIGNGNGALHKAGAGSTTFGGPITLSDSSGIGVDASSSLVLTNAAAITGTNVNLAIQCAAAATCTVGGALNLGSGALTAYGPATGAGTIVLSSASNVWTGGTTINTGAVIQVGDGASDGSIGAGSISDGGTLTYLTALNFTEANPVSGGGVFNQSGTGRMTLSGNPLSGFSGAIHINGNGLLQLANGDSLTSGTLMIGSGQADTNRLELTGNNLVSVPISIFPRAAAGTLTSTTPTTNFADVANLSGTNILSSTSPITIASGGNLLAFQCDSGYLISSNGVLAAGVGRDFAVEGAGSGELDGPITSGTGFSMNVYVLGSGTWTFNAQNTFSGTLTMSNNPTLIINGSVTASPVTNFGGTLGGVGSFSAPVTIAAGARLAPTLAAGNAAPIGVMTINSSLTLLPGSVTSVQINKSLNSSDQITGLTNVTFGGTLAVTNRGGTLANGDSFLIFSSSAYSGSFSSIVPATPGPGLAWNTTALATTGVLSVSTATVSSPVINHAAYSGGNVVISGSGGSASGTFSLLTSTNVATPLTNWTQINTGAFDGSGNFIITNSVSTNVPQSYFILSTH